MNARGALVSIGGVALATVIGVTVFAQYRRHPLAQPPSELLSKPAAVDETDPDSIRVGQLCAGTVRRQMTAPNVTIELTQINARVIGADKLRTDVRYTKNGEPATANCTWTKYRGRWEPPQWVEGQLARDYVDELATKPPAIGMTATLARLSKWGSPERINTTTTAGGTREQWVYSGNRYLYFDNDRLISIQDAK